jgi:hypothetical protein
MCAGDMHGGEGTNRVVLGNDGLGLDEIGEVGSLV